MSPSSRVKPSKKNQLLDPKEEINTTCQNVGSMSSGPTTQRHTPQHWNLQMVIF
jgi:hypothetical protein